MDSEICVLVMAVAQREGKKVTEKPVKELKNKK
jgi:hypothetical protein